MSDAVCLEGGLLVGTKYSLPSDEHEYYRVSDQVVGCNRIRCSLCDSAVKHIDAFRIWRKRLPTEEHRRFYESLDTNAFAVLRADSLFRTYLCRCNWADTPSSKPLEYGDIDGWGCSGHPSR